MLLVTTADDSWGKTVGLWKVAPVYVTEPITKVLDEGGWRVVTVGNKELADGAVLAEIDVLFLPGGWDAYWFAGFKARRNLVKFVAGGKGLLVSAVRTATRPLLPQVGMTDGYVSGLLVSASGENELAKTIDKPFSSGESSFLRVKAGPAGRVFAVSDKDPVGVYGEAYGGRYVLFGASFCRMEAEKGKELLEGTAQQLLLACLNWAASAPDRSAAERSRLQAEADLDFLRTERRCDLTRNEDAWVGNLSLVPEIHRRLSLLLEKRQFALGDLTRSLEGEPLARCKTLSDEVHQTVDRLASRYKDVRADIDAQIAKMDFDQLAEENPFVDAAKVLKRIETAPAPTAAEKSAIIALVNRCSSDAPPLDAPRSVALYLHGREIAERILPEDQLRELAARWDKAIAEFRAAVRRPGTPATVAERLRTDPLMAPYYTGRIVPTPQRAEYRDELIPMGNVALVVGKDVENPDPIIEVLTDRITRYGGRAARVAAPGADHTAVVSLGDTELVRQANGLPAVPDEDQGYVLCCTSVSAKPLIVLKGHDRLGLVWAAASLLQLIHWRDDRTMARAATVVDYPILKRRGLILTGHDFFHPATDRSGRILSYPDTELLLRQNQLLMLTAKVNEPCYQELIVADCYSRDWKHPDLMPADAHIEEDLAALGKNLTPLGITWWAGIRPHAAGDSSPEELSHKLCADEESVQGLLYFARKTEEAGGHLSIILDDIRFPITVYDKERLGTAREVDTWVITKVLARLKEEYPGARLLVCPPFYWGPVGRGWQTYGEDRDAYLRMIGERWPPEVEVFWTGRQVNGATLAIKEHFDWWMSLTKRKPYFWQNSVAYWCHVYRRHYPTDPLHSLWQSYWDGQFDVLGWYGFNGGDIARYCVTDTICADFQWNPQAYVKDKHESARRSAREAAEKFVGTDSWPLLEKVTEPLSYFDRYFVDDPRDQKGQTALDQKAAANYDVLEAKRAEAQAALKELKDKFPASVKAWTALEGFVAVANYADTIKANPSLRLYRAAVEQREKARKAGDYDPAHDVFLAAADFVGGLLKEVLVNELDEKVFEPACTLNSELRVASADFWLTQPQAAGTHELCIRARKNETAERLTLLLNGKTFFDDKAPFDELESTVARFTVPPGLLMAENNTLTVKLTATDPRLEIGAKDGEQEPKAPPLAIHYAVLKHKAAGKQ